MKVHSNWNQSGQGEKEDDVDNDEVGDAEDLFSANFIGFCRSDIQLYYLYVFCTKYGLIASAIVVMPKEAKHSGSSKDRIYIPSHSSGGESKSTKR